jgi:hypothetical protein
VCQHRALPAWANLRETAWETQQKESQGCSPALSAVKQAVPLLYRSAEACSGSLYSIIEYTKHPTSSSPPSYFALAE